MDKVQPCDNCPFRSDRPFRGFRKERAIALAETLMGDGDFYCHKTADYSNDDGPRIVSSSRLCIGAATFLENTRPGGSRANLIFRLAIGCGQLPPEQSHGVPVYRSTAEFIEGAST